MGNLHQVNKYDVYINGKLTVTVKGLDKSDALLRYVDNPQHRLLLSDKVELVKHEDEVQCYSCGEFYPRDFGYCYDCDDEPAGWSDV